MSTLPFLLSLADELDSLTNTHSYLDDFGLGFYPHRHYYRTPSIQLSLPANTNWLERHRNRRTTEPPSMSTSTVGKDGFQVCMDVQQFKSDELSVKTVDNCVIVEGKHDEREDEHGFISRQFSRRYNLPKGYDPEQVVSTLSSDGILTVKVPPPAADSLESNERIIQIKSTGEAYHFSKMDKSPGRLEDVDKEKDDLEEEEEEKQ